ncbi:hypothetical protein AB4114_07305 [Paenibacillus sp. 2RAB27]|uniref:hypothetical protein n=1 Tax=Paenibacillus sp. 2RAB27 TaxID=3232991 RepID=UPI003F9DA5EE
MKDYKLYMLFLPEKIYSIEFIKQNGVLEGTLAISELVREVTEIITSVPNISNSSHPFTAVQEDEQITITFVGYQSNYLNWTDWMEGTIWSGHISSKNLVLTDKDEFQYEFTSGELEEFHNRLNKLYDLIG